MLRQILRQAKKHLSSITPIVFTGAGGTGAALYGMNLALFNPEVNWDRKKNPGPWDNLGLIDQYNFYSVIVEYSKLKKKGPDF
ncbi:cytochrome c oxidase subunit NDUFA4-like [Acomys russatus]|uniref:cytochrome c oxidase subunit NDUFA4-like n=1 Tax=Acomys russatus TaxID=60746 RepID=UPI0021E2DBD4|nr:cytochrome c oxidase subunit NDUFA4-like [Acomys russatus]